MNTKNRVLYLLQLFLKKPWPYALTAGVLGFLYGLGIPWATVVLKMFAESGRPFLFLPDSVTISSIPVFGISFVEPITASAMIYWLLAAFSAAVSLVKVGSFLREAMGSTILAILICVVFEFVFLGSYVTGMFETGSSWAAIVIFIFFFTLVAIANIVQVGSGFLIDTEDIDMGASDNVPVQAPKPENLEYNPQVPNLIQPLEPTQEDQHPDLEGFVHKRGVAEFLEKPANYQGIDYSQQLPKS